MFATRLRSKADAARTKSRGSRMRGYFLLSATRQPLPTGKRQILRAGRMNRNLAHPYSLETRTPVIDQPSADSAPECTVLLQRCMPLADVLHITATEIFSLKYLLRLPVPFRLPWQSDLQRTRSGCKNCAKALTPVTTRVFTRMTRPRCKVLRSAGMRKYGRSGFPPGPQSPTTRSCHCD
ncbi:MAG: hypothetical protein JWN34_5195 [Bryobacterales bacterium]|nr:hypothetical protein [Bryobacterales bacterium]